MDRRAFLSGLVATWSFVAVAADVRPPRMRKEIFMSGYEVKTGKKVTETGLAIITETGVKTYPLKNEIHSVVYSPLLDIKVFIPKIDNTSYGWVKNGPLVAFKPAPGHQFYGHGAIDEKRNLLYTSQSAPLKDEYVQGFIYVYSLPDFKLVDKFPSYGGGPHDISIIRDELIVCNGAANPNMAHIDLSTRKLIRSYPTADKNISFTHCARIDDQTYAVATTSRIEHGTVPFYRFTLNKGLVEFQIPEQVKSMLMKYQLLSVVCFEEHVYATCPTTSTVFIWKAKGDFVGVLPSSGAASLAVSHARGGVIIGSGQAGDKFKLVSVDRGQIKSSTISLASATFTSGTGSHSLIIS